MHGLFGYIGLLQPLSDGSKLFLTEQFFPKNSNLQIYIITDLSFSDICRS